MNANPKNHPKDAGGGRFNLVDAAVVALVLALAAAGVYKFFFVNRGLALQNAVIEYKVLIENVRYPTVEGAKEGQTVKDVQTNAVIGTLVAKETSPYRQAVPTLDGRVVLAEVPEKYNLLLTIRSPAVVTENNITIGNKEIKIGAQIQVKTNVISCTGTVFGVEVK